LRDFDEDRALTAQRWNASRLEFGSIGCGTPLSQCREKGASMLRNFIPIAVVCVASSMSLVYGVRYLIPAFIVGVMNFWELRSELAARARS
jgi:hypothetical protein